MTKKCLFNCLGAAAGKDPGRRWAGRFKVAAGAQRGCRCLGGTLGFGRITHHRGGNGHGTAGGGGVGAQASP